MPCTVYKVEGLAYLVNAANKRDLMAHSFHQVQDIQMASSVLVVHHTGYGLLKSDLP